MNTDEVRISAVRGIKEVALGDSVGSLIVSAVEAGRKTLAEGDIVVVAQKVVSKSEGCVLHLDQVTPSPLAKVWAQSWGKDPRLIEVVLAETRRIIRMGQGVLITETHHGYVCANAGVDTSNVKPGMVTVLPKDPDKSARQIRNDIRSALGMEIGVIISDTFGRPWRVGLTNVALGIAGLDPLVDYRGQPDGSCRVLKSTQIAVADELAAAAEIVMGKNRRIPAAIIQGVPNHDRGGSGQQLLRAATHDLFR